MCGIGGILRTDGQPIPEEWLDAIDARIAYRGPDGHGRFRDRVEIDDPSAPGGKRIIEVAFVHRRLSIIDHKDGAQPMVSPRGRNDSEGLVAVVFNGCIYNHRELRKELESKGHRFVTDHSDTEVLIHGWREWGQDLAHRLEGMYAFAVWDRARARLNIFRDFCGEKPLYIHTAKPGDQPSVQFASTVAGASPGVSTSASEPSSTVSLNVSRYLQLGYLTRDIVSDKDRASVEILNPNGQFCFHVGRYEESPKDMEWHEPGDPDGDIESVLERAVKIRLEADVPLGVFLSGGVDSSLIALFARRHVSQLQTFSIRMPDTRYDESRYAENAARIIGTVHQTLDVAVNPAEDLIKLIQLLGLPFGDSSILPTYWVSKAARRHVKVVLSGDGGDENFLGYERYVAAPYLARHWRFLRRLPLRFLSQAHPKSRFHKIARLVEMSKDFPWIGLAAMESVFNLREIIAITDSSFDGLLRQSADDSPAERLQTFDVLHYLPDDLLRKVDTASMACALEVRCPFLDRALFQAVSKLSIGQLMPRGQRKGLLRQIARKYLPKEIVDRPKMGFAIPIGEWFRDNNLPHRGSGMKTLLLDHLNSAEPFGPIQLNRKAVQRFIDEHMSGKRDHGQRLFTLLTLSIWAKQQQTHKAQGTSE